MQTLVPNPIAEYYAEIATLSKKIAAAQTPLDEFCPWELPALDEQMSKFYEASAIAYGTVDLGIDREVILLNMSTYAGTKTTKTNPSLLMVARAVQHTRQTGEPITIISPSSGNKATALRAAVERAYELGITSPDFLNIVVVVPQEAHPKLWESTLSSRDDYRLANPLVTTAAPTRVAVKSLVNEVRKKLGDRHKGRRLWYTLALENYVLADQVRAFVELDRFPTDAARWHVHSVSSAYGLIGHNRGWMTRAPRLPHPGYLLVQHMDTPDMVLHLLTGTFDKDQLPRYETDRSGVLRQESSPHFPATVSARDECIDTTFYTSSPPTQDEMQSAIETHGGTGIVVSREECRDHYEFIRQAVATQAIVLPSNPDHLMEWSLIMAASGTMTAAERGLLDGVDSLVLHCTGLYTSQDYVPIRPEHLNRVDSSSAGELIDVIDETFEKRH